MIEEGRDEAASTTEGVQRKFHYMLLLLFQIQVGLLMLLCDETDQKQLSPLSPAAADNIY